MGETDAESQDLPSEVVAMADPEIGRDEVATTTVAGARSSQSAGTEGRKQLEPARHAIRTEETADDKRAGQPTWTACLYVNREEPRRVELEDLPHLVSDDKNFVWVDLTDFRRQDLDRLASLLQLHRIGVRVAFSAWQRPRLDIFGDQFMVTATVPRLDAAARKVLASELDLFVGPNFLLSAHRLPLPFADRILTRTSNNPELFELDSAYMVYVVLDDLLEYYQDLAEDLQGEVEQMEERALTDTSDGFLSDLLHFKRYAFALDQLMQQHRPVFEAFLRPDFPFASGEDIQGYFRDLNDHFSRLVDTLSTARDAVNVAFDIYVSHVSHRTNQVMKMLTMVTVLLLPATVVIALFSTNIQGIPTRWPWSFVLMLCLIAGISGLTLFVLRQTRWMR